MTNSEQQNRIKQVVDEILKRYEDECLMGIDTDENNGAIRSSEAVNSRQLLSNQIDDYRRQIAELTEEQ